MIAGVCKAPDLLGSAAISEPVDKVRQMAREDGFPRRE